MSGMKTAVRVLVTSTLWALPWGLLGGGISLVALVTGSIDAGHVTNIVPLLSGFVAAGCGLVAGGAYALIAELTAADIKRRPALGAMTGAATILIIGTVFAILSKEPSSAQKLKDLVGLVGIGSPLAAAIGAALGRLNRLSHLLGSAALLLMIIVATLCAIYLNYYHGLAVAVVWNGLEFSFPRAWYRSGNSGIDGGVTFFRHQFPWTEHTGSSITLKPAYNNFAQNPQDSLRRWEQLKDSISSFQTIPRVINFYYANAHSARNDFRCAHTVSQLGEESLIEIDCIETRSGWSFDYEGTPDHASEAMSILQER